MAFGNLRLLAHSCSKTQIDLKSSVLVTLHLAAPPSHIRSLPFPSLLCGLGGRSPWSFFTRLSCPLASCFWLDSVCRRNGKRLLRGRRCEAKVNVLFFLLFSYCLVASVLSGPTSQEKMVCCGWSTEIYSGLRWCRKTQLDPNPEGLYLFWILF